MADKIVLTNLANLQNENTAVNAINNNNAAILAAVNNSVSRNGLAPNFMEADLDMNNFRVINLPEAVSQKEPVTLEQINTIIASGQIPNGLVSVGVPVSAAMQPVVNANTLAEARELLGGFGSTIFDVEDYGAVQGVLGGASQHIAIQACIAAAAAAGGSVLLPGFYPISAPLQLPGNVTLQGINPKISGLYPVNTIDAIQMTNNGYMDLKNFAITYFIPPSTGAVALTGTAAIRNLQSGFFADIYNVEITACGTGIYITDSVEFYIDNCVVNAFVDVGVHVESASNPDAGDSTITACVFVGLNTSSQAGITWVSGGGLRIINNKIVTAQNGILFNMANVVSTTGALFVTGNSIEGIATGGGVVLQRQGSSAFMRHVIIAGNELTGQVGVWVPTDAFGATWIGSLVVNGNNYINVSQNGAAMVAFDHVIGFTVTNNLMRTLFSTGTALAIIAATCDRGLVGPNMGFAESGGSINASVISSTNTTIISPT